MNAMIDQECEETVLLTPKDTAVRLRLEASGNQNFAAMIGMNNMPFSVGRHDLSKGKRASSHEFPADTKNVSRRHAVFEINGGGFTVSDLGSKAGTFVNGVKLERDMPRALCMGDRISFGGAGANYIFEARYDVAAVRPPSRFRLRYPCERNELQRYIDEADIDRLGGELIAARYADNTPWKKVFCDFVCAGSERTIRRHFDAAVKQLAEYMRDAYGADI